MDKIKELIDDGIKNIEETGIDQENINNLNMLIDMRKDIIQCEYYEAKKGEIEMRYRDRDRYNKRSYMRGGMSGNYGHHMPEEYFDRMIEGYADYRDGMDEYNRRGNYGAKDKGLDSLEYMLESVVCFFEHLQDTSNNPEEIELIKKYASKIREM